jgi:hypothetical protein
MTVVLLRFAFLRHHSILATAEQKLARERGSSGEKFSLRLPAQKNSCILWNAFSDAPTPCGIVATVCFASPRFVRCAPKRRWPFCLDELRERAAVVCGLLQVSKHSGASMDSPFTNSILVRRGLAGSSNFEHTHKATILEYIS